MCPGSAFLSQEVSCVDEIQTRTWSRRRLFSRHAGAELGTAHRVRGCTPAGSIASARCSWSLPIKASSTKPRQSISVRLAANSACSMRWKAAYVGPAIDRIRIAAQLIEAKTGTHRWAERFDRTLEDIFAVQDEVMRTIVAILAAHVRKAETEPTHIKPPSNWQAYDYKSPGRGGLHLFYNVLQCRGRLRSAPSSPASITAPERERP